MEQEFQQQPQEVEPKNNGQIIVAVGVSVLLTALVVGFGVYFVMSKFADPQKQTGSDLVTETEGVNDISELVLQDVVDEIVYVEQESGELAQLDTNKLKKAGRYYYVDIEAQKIYYLKKNIDGDSVQLGNATTIDSKSFSIYKNDNRYAHDLINVYAVLSIPWSSDYEFGVIEKADPLTFEPKIVEQFDVSQGNTFQGWISRDKNNVYYKYEIFEHADPKSFEISENVSINKDKNNVYLWREILPKADPQTYEILLDESAAGRGTVYGKDKNNLFVDYCTLSGVDTASVNFEYVPNKGRVFSDKNGVFTIKHDEESNTCSIVRE
ncbi:MAG: DKNYY domain-containing protein [Candidatus Paceibacterota bacterium]